MCMAYTLGVACFDASQQPRSKVEVERDVNSAIGQLQTQVQNHTRAQIKVSNSTSPHSHTALPPLLNLRHRRPAPLSQESKRVRAEWEAKRAAQAAAKAAAAAEAKAKAEAEAAEAEADLKRPGGKARAKKKAEEAAAAADKAAEDAAALAAEMAKGEEGTPQMPPDSDEEAEGEEGGDAGPQVISVADATATATASVGVSPLLLSSLYERACARIDLDQHVAAESDLDIVLSFNVSTRTVSLLLSQRHTALTLLLLLPPSLLSPQATHAHARYQQARCFQAMGRGSEASSVFGQVVSQLENLLDVKGKHVQAYTRALLQAEKAKQVARAKLERLQKTQRAAAALAARTAGRPELAKGPLVRTLHFTQPLCGVIIMPLCRPNPPNRERTICVMGTGAER